MLRGAVCVLYTLLGVCWCKLYAGYHAYDVGPAYTTEQMTVITSLLTLDTDVTKVQILQESPSLGAPLSMLVSPDSVTMVTQSLSSAAIPFRLVTDNLQRSLDQNMKQNAKVRRQWLNSRGGATRLRKTTGACRSPPEHYMEYHQQVAYLQSLAEESGIAEYSTFGTTYEGRDIPIVTINGGQSELPGVWLDAGMHCREWLTHATLIYILETILLDTSEEAIDLRTNYRIYVAPNLNPDGYVYTWTTNRFWRKNRHNVTSEGCVGIDLNRNFDVNYDGCSTSKDPCHLFYSGTGPASEAETQAIVTEIKRIQAREGGIQVLITMHTYGQLWLVPWGSTGEKPDDYDELMVQADKAVAAIRGVNGLNFTAGTGPDTLYCASGMLVDWAKNNGSLPGSGAGIKYTYLPELRPGLYCDCGLDGFDPSPANIRPSAMETLAAIFAVLPRVNTSQEEMALNMSDAVMGTEDQSDTSTSMLLDYITTPVDIQSTEAINYLTTDKEIVTTTFENLVTSSQHPDLASFETTSVLTYSIPSTEDLKTSSVSISPSESPLPNTSNSVDSLKFHHRLKPLIVLVSMLVKLLI